MPDANERGRAPEVKPGQVWADNDKRSVGRHVRVDLLTVGRRRYSDSKDAPTHALVTPVVPAPWGWKADKGRPVTWIRLDRFRPTASGYRLIESAPARPEVPHG